VKERKMFDIQLVVAFVSIFVGVFLRTLLPSVKKLQAGQKWDNTYTATACFALVTSFITAIMAFPTFNLPADTAGLFTTFIVSFIFGWGLNDFYNKIFADLHDTTTATSTDTTAPQLPAESTPTQQQIPADAYAVKIGDTFLNADIQALLTRGYTRWYFPDGHLSPIFVPAGVATGQTLTSAGWVAVLPPDYSPINTHPTG
jgi:hypothetical protein